MTAVCGDGSVVAGEAEVAFSASDPVSCALRVALAGLGEWRESGWDLIDCLDKVRAAAEPLGVRLCVNACRENAVSSGMSRDMGRGMSVYLATMGARVEMECLAGSLDAAPPERVVTLDQQRVWKLAWLMSVGVPPPRGAG